MAAVVDNAKDIAWWKEPTKDQWYAWWAAWLGWTLDAFDFTVFLLIIKPIADEFHVPTTEVRATASAFSYHVGAIAGGLVPPILTYFASDPSWNLGFAIPMTIGAMLGLVNFVVALLLGPETKGVEMVPDLVVA